MSQEYSNDEYLISRTIVTLSKQRLDISGMIYASKFTIKEILHYGMKTSM